MFERIRQAGRSDPQEIVRKDLEIKKLEREIAQLSFVTDKQALITPAGEASFEQSKRELDLANLALFREKEARETERFAQEKSKLEQEIKKLTLEREQLERDSKSAWTGLLKWSGVIGPIGSVATAIIALGVSWSSLNVTKNLSEEQGKLSEQQAKLSEEQAKLSEEQISKLKADQILDQDKFFREALEKATESSDSTPIFRQVAFIRALDGFWNPRQAPALASTLLSIIVYHQRVELQQACAEELARAFNADADQNDRSIINHFLFGTTAGDDERLGMVQEAWAKLSDQPQGGDPRRTALLNIISNASGHLEKTNFHDFSAESLLMTGAKFAGSNLKGLQARQWALDKADFSNCDLRSSNFADCSLDGASLAKTQLAAAIFTGSNLEQANLKDAADIDTCYLGGANILHVQGLTQQSKEKAFDQGAVEMSSLDFERWKLGGQNLPRDPHERRSWREAGFPLDQEGNPVLSDGHLPKNGFQAVAHY